MKRLLPLLWIIAVPVVGMVPAVPEPPAQGQPQQVAQAKVEKAASVVIPEKMAWADPQDVGGKGVGEPPVDEVESHDQETKWAIDFLKKIPDDPQYTRYQVRMLDVSKIPAKVRSLYLRALVFVLNSCHLEPDVTHLYPVPNTGNRLWWFGLDSFGWSAETWAKIADREPYYREGVSISPPLAQVARSLVNVEQNPKTFALQVIVRADWLFRDAVDQTRSDTYFDLLFSRFSSGTAGADGWREETTTVNHRGGTYKYPDDSGRVIHNVEPGQYTVHLRFKTKGKATAGQKFPKDLDDIDRVFGIDVANQFIKRSGIDPSQGAVVEDGASIVATQNRLIVTQQGQVKLGSKKHQTFDVLQTSGKRDFTETRNKDFDFDFQEIFFTLPNGGQASALADKNKKLLAKADSDIAQNTQEFTRTRPRATVVNPGSCYDCHSKAVIIPENHLAKLRADGVKVNFLDKRAALADSAFFYSDYEQQLKNDQAQHVRFVAKTSGFDPEENSKMVVAFGKFYDRPLDATQAARELGVPVDLLLTVLIDGIKDDKGIVRHTPRARLNHLATGGTIPRSVWEFSAFQEASLLLKAAGK